jgi:hypothetical protein
MRDRPWYRARRGVSWADQRAEIGAIRNDWLPQSLPWLTADDNPDGPVLDGPVDPPTAADLAAYQAQYGIEMFPGAAAWLDGRPAPPDPPPSEPDAAAAPEDAPETDVIDPTQTVPLWTLAPAPDSAPPETPAPDPDSAPAPEQETTI